MKELKKPYTRLQLNQFIDECNALGNIRIERFNGDVYGLYDHEAIQDGIVVDLSETEEYKAQQAQIAKERRTEEIMAELAELDEKRIRAVCEPNALREDGTTWLEYYNTRITELREELNSL